MKKLIIFSLLPLALVVLLVAVLAGRGQDRGGLDGERTLRLLTGGAVRELAFDEYLVGVLAGEMPASFESEALKAQAVAARTYALRQLDKGVHTDYDLCDQASCCTAWLDESVRRARWGADFAQYEKKLRQAVADTDGQYLQYGGEPILAVFHASSYGSTEDSGSVWLETLPYLTAAATPETADTVTGLFSTLTIPAEELRQKLESLRPGIVLHEDPRFWLGFIEASPSGRVMALRAGSERLTGTELRMLLGLRSTMFDFRFRDGNFVFSVWGYGHGVGLSQYGANLLARQGQGHEAILAHYYRGAELVRG